VPSLACAPPPAAGRRFDVVGLGQNSMDLVVGLEHFPANNSKQRIDDLSWMPGGQVASALVGCARLGWRACYIGRFGDDEPGRVGRHSLEDEGVELAWAPVVPGGRTRTAVILVDHHTGSRTVLWDRDARMALRGEDVPVEAVKTSRVLLVDCDDVEASIEAARVARSAGVITVIDVEAVVPGLEHLLRLIDVVIASEGFPEALTALEQPEAALDAMSRSLGAAMVCVTLGPGGSLALCAGELVRTPAFHVTCVDSTGAGDAFRAGFISALLRWGPGDAGLILRHANAVAALSCGATGARRGLPRRAEVDALLMGAHS
jgi:sugar/nucleoside kinase (ribokinase family)